MRALFSAFFLLLYLLTALFVVILILHNTAEVSLNTVFWGEVAAPIYAPIALAFGIGLLLGLFNSLLLATKQLFQRFKR